jgi:hypothetical protein
MKPARIPSDVNEFLTQCAGKAELSLNRYEDARRVNRSTAAVSDSAKTTWEIQFGGATWQCELDAAPVADRKDAVDLTARFTVTAGEARECGAGVSFLFDDWRTENYVLVPGAVYNGNRFETRTMSYPPRLTDPADLGSDTPIIVSDVPRLNLHPGVSRLQLLTGDGATPAAGFYCPRNETGFLLLTVQGTETGDSGLSIEESDDRSKAVFSVCAPGVRQDMMYMMCTTQAPSRDRGADLVAGDCITLRLRLFMFTCPSVQHLFDLLARVRKDVTGPVTRSHAVPFSHAWMLMEEKQNRDNWCENPGFYSQESGLRPLFGTGWGGCGIVINTPLLIDGGETSRKQVVKTLDFFFTHCVSPAGFFYDHHNDTEPLDELRVPLGEHPRHLARRDFEALYALIKQFRILEKQGPGFTVPNQWLAGVRGCAEAWAKQWQRHGQLGQDVDLRSGDIIIGGGTNGGLAPAALILVSQYLGDTSFLPIAEEIALSFHKKYVARGLIHGGTFDALKSPDSESAFALLDSFVTLHEATGRQRWIEMAEETARQCASWCVSYDFRFPPDTIFGRLDMRTTGSVYPNVQNKHAAPGICTLSGDSLLRLFRATGNRFYLELLQEIAHNLPQYLSRPDRPIPSNPGDGSRPLPSGWMNERVNMSDWEGRENLGGVFYGSCWSEVATMLTCAEVPGLYVQPDTGLVCAIDHVDAEVIEQAEGRVRVNITNPTQFPARVKVLCEKETDTSRPLEQPALVGCPVLELPPKSTREVAFP